MAGMSVKNNVFLGFKKLLFLLLLLSLLWMIVACGGNRLTRQELYQAYQQALASTDSRARSDWNSDPEALDAAIDRLQGYYREITRPNVERLTQQVYAEDAYLCDTLHIARGADQIEAYFLKTADRVNSMQVSILDYSASGREVYTRWAMTIAADDLADGQPVTSYGISHFRFDADGKVILHQDFWDASAGFFEQLPVLGWVIPRIRGGL